ncbi:MAG: hypothetical protein JJU13_01530 [Balneolaceae bacterium]|nr:hypothetical protein [Balneolaceae bacterium]
MSAQQVPRIPESVDADTNALNKKLHQSLLEDGRIFLSTTRIDENDFFSVAVLSVRTHLQEAALIRASSKSHT